MAPIIEIRFIKKSDRTNHYERILSIGGINPDGKRWEMSETDAISNIKNGKFAFYISRGGNTVDVIIAKSQFDHEYLKTVADGEQPNNLLSLPECP